MTPAKRLKHLIFLLIFLIIGGGIIYSQYPQQKAKDRKMPQFKKGDDYKRDWKKVEAESSKGLPKTALELVEAIYNKAKKADNHAQIIKSLAYMLQLRSQFEEDIEISALQRLEQEIADSQYPATPVLQSMLAESYWRYYQNNRWKILDRSNTADFSFTDIATWDGEEFVSKISQLYLASLSESDFLQQTRLDIYDDIISGDKKSRKFRPTLYDLLAHRALDYFKNEETHLSKPVYAYQLSGEALFTPAESFVSSKITSADSTSLQLQAVHIYQELLKIHLDDDDKTALIDADLSRLEFMNDYGVGANRDQQYFAALQALLEKYKGAPASTWISFEIAQYYLDQSSDFDPLKHDGDSSEANSPKWMRRKALETCQSADRSFPKSEGAQSCRALAGRIQQKALSISLETVNRPGQPFRALVNYQNVSEIFLRVASVDPAELTNMRANRRMNNNQWFDYFRGRPAVESWQINLPDDGDYNAHSVEIKMPSLAPGNYVVLLGTDKDFSRKEQAAGTGIFWVSDISFVEKDGPEKKQQGFYVLHRHSGQPLSGASVQSWINDYDRKARKNISVKGPQFTTDQNGYFDALPMGKQRKRYRLDIRHGDDRLFLDQTFYNQINRTHHRPASGRSTFFFTDRAIYRPGQTVYFKGIMIEKKAGQSSIVSDAQTTVMLFDANQQKVSELKLTSNEYGTFSGTFVLPTAGITGLMRIKNEYGEEGLQVEEYKRPRFEVTFDPLKGSFKLNETVKVTGKASAYSGANIDNAELRYRVVRETTFPYYWGWGYKIGPWPTAESMEITNGVSKTGADGSFDIEFTAVPDPTVEERFQPVFNYSVYVDVTDIGGETHSAEAYVWVGKVALSIRLDVPATLHRDRQNEIAITSENLNGEFEAASGTITVHQLQAPDRILRERFWQQPNRHIIKKEDYIKFFPHDIYSDEDDFHNWETGKQVASYSFDTREQKNLLLKDISRWNQGKYRLELTTEDRFGSDIKLVEFFTLNAPGEKSVPDNALAWIVPVKSSAEPGQNGQFTWGSAADDVHALLEIYAPGKTVESRWISAGKKKQELSIPIEESYRGGIRFKIWYVKYGRVLQCVETVQVPWSNKELKISYETFRDKLKPGQQEEWRVRISGPKGDKVAAEMVAGLYDASLDAFLPHDWHFAVYPERHRLNESRLNFQSNFRHSGFSADGQNWNNYPAYYQRSYEFLNWSPAYSHMEYSRRRFGKAAPGVMAPQRAMAESVMEEADATLPPGLALESDEAIEAQITAHSGQNGDAPGDDGRGGDAEQPPAPQVRKNLNETAFFFPHLQTDANGDILIAFQMPEALTRWKFMGFAHTKNLEYGLTENSTVTQKELMVVPNAPRFFREGDRITFSGKVSNLTEKAISGTASLQLFDALTMKPLDKALGNKAPQIPFNTEAGGSAPLRWQLSIPEGVQAVTYRIIAKSKNFSDGEESSLPVLTNRMLVTESLPLPIRAGQTKTFKLEKLINSGSSQTLKHQRLTLEFTSNPAWYAVQALPYMMEYPYECAEQIFSRFYANSLASHIVNSNPKIQRVFEQWKNHEPQALLSNLEKNQELKALLLEETPWVMQAKSESESKRRIALLFDLNKMSLELQSALRKLADMQAPNGAWPWFPGMPESRYITQHIATGLAHLKHLGLSIMDDNEIAARMMQQALLYLDEQMDEDYRRLVERKSKLSDMHIGRLQIQYLYARSYFANRPVQQHQQKAFDYWKDQAQEYWLRHDFYMQGMIALALQRYEDGKTPAAIVKSLREHSISSDEMGMYWKSAGGYYWHQAPIERQALLIEVFDEVAGDPTAVDELKLWLLKQKQTQAWKTTKATAEACYALLLRGTDFLANDKLVEVTVGSQKLDPANDPDLSVESGTGYFKTAWSGGEIKPQMGNVTVTQPGETAAWGALYWQYFEQLDKITQHETPLQIKKQLFLEKHTDRGPVITPLTNDSALKPGDLLKVRIELRVDRLMEYVHMKDMRAAGLEPLNVLSQYKYQGGLGYYESTRDASTNFFFDQLPKGTYVFEYPLRVTHEGDFSNGITSIQCMYAPEFTSHSEGVRVAVGD